MVSLIRCRSASLRVGLLGAVELSVAGTHNLSRSLARQCGHRCEGAGVRFWGYGAGLLSGGAVGGGSGSRHSLMLRGFRRLVSLDLALDESSRGRTSCLSAASLVSSKGVGLNEEGLDFGRDGDVMEEEVRRGIAAS
jgi:hypothetical protein